ncbi:hypothetical protein [Dendronalium sp. ChiSLP03b]|uniref:hypothetical protein n=1 Tax=Dendronalium sp. ChiSLP03b TaxID=3075381 RepID=UPI002AD292C9|nr:hypothetical protein [Dendronalium sp. ChiSLP03b]MDZ8208823.1 hypothetical protein [Dendronalium sp. ChiSLP03b]
MNEDKYSLWIDYTRSRYFLIPENQDISTGDLIIFNLTGEKKTVSSTALTSFEVTEVEVRAFLETELNQLMEKIEISEKMKNELPNILEELFSSSNIEKCITEIVSQVLNLADEIDQSPELLEHKLYESLTSLSKDLFAKQEKQLKEKRKEEYRKSAKEAVTQSLSSFVLPSFTDKDWFSEISLLPKKEQK